jgi:uncharacterized protein (DUF3084 family)
MRQQVEHRLHELKAEWASGQQMLADLEAQQTNLRNTLLRISGAIQVLEELLAQAPEEVHPPVSCTDADQSFQAGPTAS